MGGLSDDYSQDAWELEKIISSVRINPKVLFHYTSSLNEKVMAPAYIIPFEYTDGSMTGFFSWGDSYQVKLGFQFKPDVFSDTKYFDIIGKEISESKEPASDVTYIPIRRAKVKERSGNIDRSLEGLFDVYMLDGTDSLSPLLCVTRTEDGLQGLGLYRTDGGSPAFYHKKISPTKGLRLNSFFKKSRIPSQSKRPRKMFRAKKTKTPAKKKNSDINWSNPKSLVSYLDRYVVGQSEAKRTISIAFSNFMTYYTKKIPYEDKDNIMIIGPTGSGKTFMIDLLVDAAELPKAKSKLVGKSGTGFVGENLSSVFDQFGEKIGEEEAPYGVVFFDEVDKLAKESLSGGFMGTLQNELIGWLEDATVQLTSEKRKGSGFFRTRNLLYVFAGAFQDLSGGLDEVIKKRMGIEKSGLGFGAKNDSEDEALESDLLFNVLPDDLIEYGLMRELVGRIPKLAVTRPLSLEDKVRILKESKRSPLRKYAKLLKFKGYNLKLRPEAYEAIANACPSETGARALSSVCGDIFDKILFEPELYVSKDSKKILLTEKNVPELLTLYQ